MKKTLFGFLTILLLLSSCRSTAQEQAGLKLTDAFNQALLTAVYETVRATSTNTVPSTSTPNPPTATPPAPSLTPEPSATMILTPPAVPGIFTVSGYDRDILPRTYIDDTCAYLRMRWDPANSAPGTVVMPIMYHSITGDANELAPDGSQIHESDLKMTIEHAVEVGFETITTEELVGFLERNAPIPRRSLIMILDDRRPGVARVTFLPYLEEYNWTLTLSWLIGDTDSRPATYLPQYPDEVFSGLWEQMETYYAMGYFDIQAHGYIHNTPISDSSSEDYIHHEIVDSRDVLREHFYCKDHATGEPVPDCDSVQPLAYIWPGGGFSKRGAEVAREAGYHIGFTINPRGPVMFNWIPLADTVDPRAPAWMPEMGVGDPLMVLPRYWSSNAAYKIDEVITIGKDAEAYAREHMEDELAYYRYYCEASLGPIPTEGAGN